jgi:hypothetical protein
MSYRQRHRADPSLASTKSLKNSLNHRYRSATQLKLPKVITAHIISFINFDYTDQDTSNSPWSLFNQSLSVVRVSRDWRDAAANSSITLAIHSTRVHQPENIDQPWLHLINNNDDNDDDNYHDAPRIISLMNMMTFFPSMTALQIDCSPSYVAIWLRYVPTHHLNRIIFHGEWWLNGRAVVRVIQQLPRAHHVTINHVSSPLPDHWIMMEQALITRNNGDIRLNKRSPQVCRTCQQLRCLIPCTAATSSSNDIGCMAQLCGDCSTDILWCSGTCGGWYHHDHESLCYDIGNIDGSMESNLCGICGTNIGPYCERPTMCHNVRCNLCNMMVCRHHQRSCTLCDDLDCCECTEICPNCSETHCMECSSMGCPLCSACHEAADLCCCDLTP